MNKIIMMLAGLSLTVIACGNADRAQEKEGTVSRTIVTFQPDGSSEVKQVQISQAQQRAEVAAREKMLQNQAAGSSIGTAAQAISTDPGCDASDLWLFDDYNQTGSNEICFYGAGAAQLANYTSSYCYGGGCFFGTWWHTVRSYWAGVSPGYFLGDPYLFGEPPGYEYFGPWQRVDNAGPFAQHAFEVGLSF